MLAYSPTHNVLKELFRWNVHLQNWHCAWYDALIPKLKIAVIPWQHCKEPIQKIRYNYSQTGIGRPQSLFPHSCVCERFKYSYDRSAYSASRKYVDWSWEYINRPQTHECGNWAEVAQFPEKEYINEIFVAVRVLHTFLISLSLYVIIIL